MGQPKEPSISVEGVSAARLDEFERHLLPAVHQALAHPTVHPENEVQRIGSESRNLDDLSDPSGIDTAQARTGPDIV